MTETTVSESFDLPIITVLGDERDRLLTFFLLSDPVYVTQPLFEGASAVSVYLMDLRMFLVTTKFGEETTVVEYVFSATAPK